MTRSMGGTAVLSRMARANPCMSVEAGAGQLPVSLTAGALVSPRSSVGSGRSAGPFSGWSHSHEERWLAGWGEDVGWQQPQHSADLAVANLWQHEGTGSAAAWATGG